MTNDKRASEHVVNENSVRHLGKFCTCG